MVSHSSCGSARIVWCAGRACIHHIRAGWISSTCLLQSVTGHVTLMYLPVCSGPYLSIRSHVELIIVFTAQQAGASKTAANLKALHTRLRLNLT